VERSAVSIVFYIYINTFFFKVIERKRLVGLGSCVHYRVPILASLVDVSSFLFKLPYNCDISVE